MTKERKKHWRDANEDRRTIPAGCLIHQYELNRQRQRDKETSIGDNNNNYEKQKQKQKQRDKN